LCQDAATAITLRREIAVLDQVLFLFRMHGGPLERTRRGASQDVMLGLLGKEPASDSEIPAEMGHVEPKRQSDANCIASCPASMQQRIRQPSPAGRPEGPVRNGNGVEIDRAGNMALK
jgi:hypothetical protein